MNRKQSFILAAVFLGAFGLWTAAVCFLDVRPIGPDGSLVGFGAVNGFIHALTGVHMWLYTVTDWLGLVPVAFGFGFGCLGLMQLLRRKSLRKVDRSILVLGGFYIVVTAMYLLFETVVINYRPVRIEGVLEASYPSSTTLLVLCVMPTAAMQVKERIKNPRLRGGLLMLTALFTGFMVAGRLVSGVHWLSDIIGGILLSAGLVMIYHALCGGESR